LSPRKFVLHGLKRCFKEDMTEQSGQQKMHQMLDKDVMEPITSAEARKKMNDGFKFTRTFMFYKDKYIKGVFDKLKGRFVNMDTFNHPDDNINSTSPNVMAESVNVILVEVVEKGRKL
jgi:hypothetical protein